MVLKLLFYVPITKLHYLLKCYNYQIWDLLLFKVKQIWNCVHILYKQLVFVILNIPSYQIKADIFYFLYRKNINLILFFNIIIA